MVTVYDVNANKFVQNLKEELKDKDIEQPEWSYGVKTSAGKERPPQQSDWWFSRAASLFRKIYTEGPIGVNSLKREYSTRKNRGHQPEKRYLASGKIIRTILKQLEELGYVASEDEGRVVTPKGQSFLDNLAYEIKEGK